MKSVALAMAIAIITHSANAIPTAGLGSINATLADWGIIKVPDLGLANVNASDVDLDARDIEKRATYYTFQAFTGDFCDYGAGTLKSYGDFNTHCDNTAGRHSFRVTGGPAYVSADPNLNCPAHDSGAAPGGLAYAGCYNVNTGLNWQSSFTYFAPS